MTVEHEISFLEFRNRLSFFGDVSKSKSLVHGSWPDVKATEIMNYISVIF